MRQFYSQPIPTTSPIRITAADPQFRGTSSHSYILEGFDTANNRAARSGGFVPRFKEMSIVFCSDESTVEDIPDGVSADALLAVLADHIQGKLSGPNGSVNKQLALDYIESAREVLAQDLPRFEQNVRRPFASSHYDDYGRTGTL